MDVDWLASEDGRAAIAALRDVDPLRARSLHPHLSAQQVADALVQAQRRPPHFPLPLVTTEGVQQASPAQVAERRAARVAASGTATIIDAGCGIGVDAWAFAHAGLQVIAYETHPDTLAVARRNLAGLDVDVRHADVTTVDLPPGVALYVDPARRLEHRQADGRAIRPHDPQLWRPPWDWVLQQAQQRPVVARIRPGHRGLPDGVEWHCSSISHRLVDATVWFPPLAQSPRRATVATGTQVHELTGSQVPPVIGPVARFIIDPDPAIVRAGLVAHAAGAAGGHLLDEHLAFITTEVLPQAWLGRCMEVLEPVALKRAAAVCRRLGLPSATLWARGFERPPRLSMAQGQEGVVVTARVGSKRRTHAWVGRRVH